LCVRFNPSRKRFSYGGDGILFPTHVVKNPMVRKLPGRRCDCPGKRTANLGFGGLTSITGPEDAGLRDWFYGPS